MNKRNRLKVYIFRIVAILFSAFIVNILTISAAKTYSWFYDWKVTSVDASVIDSKDIIKVDIIYEIDGVEQPPLTVIPRPSSLSEITNPKTIRITKIGSQTSPHIYFDVKGDIANHILNIHPVDFLDKDNKEITTETVNIVATSNTTQSIILGNVSNGNKEKYTSGKLVIKYLNGFINEEFDIKFKNGYLANLATNSSINNK